MNKKVLVISTSLRRGGNSERLADSFAEGAKESGNQVEKVELSAKNIHFCLGCLRCLEAGRCVIRDDADLIVQKMRTAEVLVFATPIYYYGMSGQMKTLLDRANPLYQSDYSFREIYLLSAAAEDSPEVDANAITSLNGWISCFERAKLAGVLCAGGVDVVGAIAGHPALRRAYEMGLSV